MSDIDHSAEARIDHRRTAEEANREAMRRKGEDSRRWHRKANVHAALALVEQQRIANLIAAFEMEGGPYRQANNWTDGEEDANVRICREVREGLRL